MKNKGIKTLLWLLIAAVWTGALKVGLYMTEMQYASKVAPNQVDDDNAYTILETHGTTNTIIEYLYLSGLVIIIWKVILVWTSKKNQTI